MTKKVDYKGITYTLEFKWSGSSYGVRCIESNSGFSRVPIEYIQSNDIDKMKPYFIEAIENNHDLKSIELWDGKL